MCEIKFIRIYSKFFGGKIWLNLHTVFPDKIFDRKIQNGFPQNFPPKVKWIASCAKFSKKSFLDWISFKFLNAKLDS